MPKCAQSLRKWDEMGRQFIAASLLDSMFRSAATVSTKLLARCGGAWSKKTVVLPDQLESSNLNVRT